MAPIVARRNRSMSSSITIRTLTDGGQQPAQIAHEIAEFIAAAKRTLDPAAILNPGVLIDP